MVADPSDIFQIRNQLEAHHQAAFRWSLCCCRGDLIEAEEVLQSTYLKVLEGSAKYGGTSSFKTWLFAVIRHTAADHRRKHFLRRLFGEKAAAAPAGHAETPDDRSERAAVRRCFNAALEALSARQREVLELVFDQALTLREAAEVMGVSVGTAGLHYERGKERLRTLMADVAVSGEARKR